MKRVNYPSVSILTLNYNTPPELFEKHLQAVHTQNYPKDKFEHIILDGGSTNKCLEVAKKYRTTIISDSKLRNKVWKRQAIGIKKAKHPIIMWLLPDNILEHKNSLQLLTKPFIDNEDIIASYTARYGYNSELSILDRYCGLMGVSDPVAFYMGKADREPWYLTKYSKGEVVSKSKGYDVVRFTTENLPTVGDNGFLVRKKILLKSKTPPHYFFHTDVIVDLLRLGYNNLAVVYDTSIVHVIRSNVFDLIRRRVSYMERDASKDSLKHRRYAVFSTNSMLDLMKLARFVFYTVTVVEPLSHSIRGYLKIRDKAWFIHPFICYVFLLYYAKFSIKRVFNKIR